MKKLLLTFCLLFAFAPHAFASGYIYYRTITQSHTKIGATDQTNFPMEISETDSWLATVANSGKVQNTTTQTGGGASITVPADVIFTSDSACATKLNWEFETYSATTGHIEAFVQIPSVSHTVDTVIYECYDNAAVSTWQGNITGTWDANFVEVQHFPDGSTLDVKDSTNANNGTNHSDTAGAGQIDGATVSDGSTSYVDDGANASVQITGNITVSAWFKYAAFTANTAKAIVAKGYDGTIGTAYGLEIDPRCTANSNEADRIDIVTYYVNTGTCSGAYDTSHTFTSSDIGVWHYAAGTWNGVNWKIYLDGVNTQTTIDDTRGPSNPSSNLAVGSEIQTGTPQRLWNGSIDEVRVSNSARSADWLTAEYNNGVATSTFYTIGAETALTPAVGALHQLVLLMGTLILRAGTMIIY